MRSSMMVLALLCTAALAWATDVDWRVFGGDAGNVPTLCFFDARGVVRAVGGVRVWTKCLLVQDIQAIDLKKDYDGRIWNAAQRKVDEHYVPPLATLEDLDFDAMMRTIVYEQIANISIIRPLVLAYVELDCTERMMRNLDTTVQSGDDRQINRHPSDWQHIAPESGAAALFKLLCH
jgi:hypothetical protein